MFYVHYCAGISTRRYTLTVVPVQWRNYFIILY